MILTRSLIWQEVKHIDTLWSISTYLRNCVHFTNRGPGVRRKLFKIDNGSSINNNNFDTLDI